MKRGDAPKGDSHEMRFGQRRKPKPHNSLLFYVALAFREPFKATQGWIEQIGIDERGEKRFIFLSSVLILLNLFVSLFTFPIEGTYKCVCLSQSVSALQWAYRLSVVERLRSHIEGLRDVYSECIDEKRLFSHFAPHEIQKQKFK